MEEQHSRVVGCPEFVSRPPPRGLSVPPACAAVPDASSRGSSDGSGGLAHSLPEGKQAVAEPGFRAYPSLDFHTRHLCVSGVIWRLVRVRALSPASDALLPAPRPYLAGALAIAIFTASPDIRPHWIPGQSSGHWEHPLDSIASNNYSASPKVIKLCYRRYQCRYTAWTKGH